MLLKFDLPSARFLNFPQNSAPIRIGLFLLIRDCIYYYCSKIILAKIHTKDPSNMRINPHQYPQTYILFTIYYELFSNIVNDTASLDRLIRNSAEFWGKFKKRALGRSNLRNASKNLRNAQCSDFQS